MRAGILDSFCICWEPVKNKKCIHVIHCNKRGNLVKYPSFQKSESDMIKIILYIRTDRSRSSLHPFQHTKYLQLMSRPSRKPTVRKVSTRIRLSMPRRLTWTDTFRLLWIFCFMNHYSIPLRRNVSARISLRGLHRLIWVDTLR